MMKVMLPDLPTADELLPYLRLIDRNRQYTNHGPLVQELERRTQGVAVANCTLGLELAAKWAFKHTVRVPAFTFPATAMACKRAGLEVILCDVDSETLALRDIDENSLPVCPFGVPVAGRLVDAAGAFGNPVNSNRVYSLHATKTLPAGEGGIVCGEEGLLNYIRLRSNFGFDDGKCWEIGTNAKMSEYHAAVALASLDRWVDTRAQREHMESRYRRNLSGIVRLFNRPPGVYAIFPIFVNDAESTAHRLAEHGIETRRWYVPTLDHHPAFRGVAVDGPLKVCERLNRELLCLPYHGFMTDSDVDYVCEVLTENRKAA